MINIFFKKHLETKNKGIKEIKLPNNNEKKENYYYITDVTGLLAEVQMNSIEFHTWGSKITSLEEPDMMIFDLDPDELLS